MANPLDYTITKHAIDRLIERNIDFAKIVEPLTSSILKTKAAYDFMSTATEEKSFLNNSKFMMKLNEKYGFEKSYTLFVRDDSVFVGVANNNDRYIATVLNRSLHHIPHIRNKVQKFGKKSEIKLGVYFPPSKR